MFQLFVILFVITLYIKYIFKEIPLSVKNIIVFCLIYLQVSHKQMFALTANQKNKKIFSIIEYRNALKNLKI